MNIELTFQKSRSKDFSNVLKQCRIFDLFTEKEYRLEIASFEELFQKWNEFNIIYHHTKKWAGTVFVLDGKQDKTNDTFYRLQEVKECYKQYREFNARELFCDHAD